MSRQTKIESAIESFVNISLGFIISLLTQIVVFPIIGIEASLSDNLILSVVFTTISLIRSYWVRRYFNNKKNG